VPPGKVKDLPQKRAKTGLGVGTIGTQAMIYTTLLNEDILVCLSGGFRGGSGVDLWGIRGRLFASWAVVPMPGWHL